MMNNPLRAMPYQKNIQVQNSKTQKTKGPKKKEYHVADNNTWSGIRTPKDFEIDLVTSETSGYLRSPRPPDFLSVCTHAR
jgi:hypothetical protein